MISAKILPSVVLGIGIFSVSSVFAAVTGVSEHTIANNTPKFAATAKKLGVVDPSTVIEVSIWLKPHNKADLDAVAKDLYDPQSKNYRHWLSKSEFVSRYGPTAAEEKKVEAFFTSNNLKVVKVGPDNFYVRARGTVGAVNSAFHVSLTNFEVKGKTIRSNEKDPYISGESASLVASVAGLDSMEYTHPIETVAKGSLPGAPAGVSAAAATPQSSSPFNSACFGKVKTEKFTSEGALPTATYSGGTYTSNPALCGYTPQNIYGAYNLNALYQEGYDGTGQTIVIIDWCGSPTITHDANVFSEQFGLPKLTSANFSIINTAPSYCASPDPEINIDVEWAHAIAPGASIDLVVPPTASFQDVDEAYFYAVNYQLGGVISGSYGSEEYYTDPTVLVTEDLISETAAVLGISANFSTGDDGDFTFDFPQYDPPSVSAPADSPYVTGIGGVSLALNPDNSVAWTTGWGTNIGLLAEEGTVFDPPSENTFFDFGSGGGPSGFFAKPSYQKKLAGPARLLPDISWLADPYTGAYIAISEPGTIPTTQYQVYGGTSLACPMFSGLWAIANQEAGAPLGQAAPYLYSLPAGTIADILPHGSAYNVTGTVVDSAGTTKYSAADLAYPYGSTTFKSVLWDYPFYQDTTELITFGTDSGLTITKGWDDVTGVGVPNGKNFADYFKP